jgi:ABC-2 type transport system permease protein
LRTLGKLAWIEIKLFVREPITMVFTLALPIIFIFVMGGVFGNTPDPEGEIYRGVGAMDYYVPAYIGLVISSIGVVGLPVHLTAYRERGVLRRLRASSISIWAIMGSQLVVSFVIAILGSILVIAIGLLTYKVHLAMMPGFFIGAFVLSTLCFAAFGFFLGAVIPTTRAAQGIGMILFFVMLILGGAGPPPEVLPYSMQIVGSITPVHHVILTLQEPWLGFGWQVTASLIVAGFLAATTILSVKFFRWQ